MSWGTTWEFKESLENMMGTHWEQEEKPKKIPSLPLPPKEKIIEPLMNTCQAFSLVTRN
jgi:hypothetical protein